VLHVGRDGVGIAGIKLVFGVAGKDTDTAGEDVTALLVGVGMEWDDVVLAVAHLGDHRLRPNGQQIERYAEGRSLLGCSGFYDVDHNFNFEKLTRTVVLPNENKISHRW